MRKERIGVMLILIIAGVLLISELSKEKELYDAELGHDAADEFADLDLYLNEANNYFGTLNTEALPSDRRDIFGLLVIPDNILEVIVTPLEGQNIDLKLYNSTQGEVFRSASGSAGESERLYSGIDTYESWYLEIYVPDGISEGGRYHLDIELSMQVEANPQGDAGNSTATAANLADGTFEGCLFSKTDEVDYYSIQGEAGKKIKIELTPSTGTNFDLMLLDATGTMINSSSAEGNEVETLIRYLDKGGTYYIVVSVPDQGINLGKYTLSVDMDYSGAEKAIGIPSLLAIAIILSGLAPLSRQRHD